MIGMVLLVSQAVQRGKTRKPRVNDSPQNSGVPGIDKSGRQTAQWSVSRRDRLPVPGAACRVHVAGHLFSRMKEMTR
jgi:hypothetical protein